MKKYHSLKQKAQERNIEFNLNNFETMALVISDCIYCNRKCYQDEKIMNGIDRIDSNIGYIRSNCVPACGYCNSGKNDFSFEIFCEWIQRIKLFQLK